MHICYLHVIAIANDIAMTVCVCVCVSLYACKNVTMRQIPQN